MIRSLSFAFPPFFRRPRAALAALGVLLMLGFGGLSPAQARGAPDSFADIVEKLLPSVVNVYTTQVSKSNRTGGKGEEPDFPLPPGSPFEQWFRDYMNRPRQPNLPPRRHYSLGSGFIIDSAGYIVTNNHVIEDADEIRVKLHDNSELPAKLVGRDVKTDLALLKVESGKPLAAVAFGDSDKARIGDWVIAIGNPFDLGGTVTAGILSARNRSTGGTYDDFLQTDAPINRGNSGGPMFDMDGKVIGVNSAILSPTPNAGSVGIGFAIASNLARSVIDQLRTSGSVKRGWLGVNIQAIDEDIASGFGLDKARGALVSGVSENSPAAKAQFKQGDIILKFDGKEVPEFDRLPRIVAETPIGKPVDVVLWRNKKEITLKVTVGELKDGGTGDTKPSSDGDRSAVEVPSLGVTVQGIDSASREKFGLADDQAGILVTETPGDGNAYEKGLRPGDVIAEVDQEPVRTPADLIAKVTAAKEAKKKTVLITLNRKGDTRFIAVKLR